MSPDGAYEDEMGHLPDFDDRDLNRLLAGRDAPDGLEDLAGFVRDAREGHVGAPRADVASRHLAAMAMAAHEHPVNAPAAVRPTPSLWRRLSMPRNRQAALVVKLTAATATMAMATAGLAVAGVDLPDPADDAFKRVGVELPNQAGGSERSEQAGERGRSESVLQVIRGTAPEMRGCEFGHRVAAAARGEALPESARDACARSDRDVVPHGKAKAERDAAEPAKTGTGNGLGAEQSERAKGQRTATPEERRQFGLDTAERARQHGQQQRESQGTRPENTGPPEGAGRPETPKAAPEGVGRPDSTPSGPPEGTPNGPPEGVPGGRP